MPRISRIYMGPFALLLCCSVFGVARASSAQADLNGYWDLRMPNPNGDGTFRDTYLEIEQNGESIRGMLIRQPPGIPIPGSASALARS
jgi:alpha-galactosidase